jgi:undecaprenyl-diphosphatase
VAPADIDPAIVELLQDLRGGPLDAVFEALSRAWVMQALGLVLLVLAVRRTRSYEPLIAAAIAIPVAELAPVVLKPLIGRHRPPVDHPEIHALGSLPSDYSFPSGHACSAFAAAVVLMAFLPRLRWVLLTIATLVAVSRVWLGVHYPSDVIAGAALGAAIGFASLRLAHRVHRRGATAGPPRSG